ncbi:rhomboid family intramembrane serine protease [Tepiditoga spiralis]|uniref:Rhomboid family intramembrane serine protease n=1 Tax=Tepiditoga spiralis TaxID=2108365 RepID=A0A7G1GBN0_9BACT|nr:rhomboid family intramembrane serine protease [Tepiditoga spiralis]BBE31199.1 rhomboid family intramembrane serine protease [Tepiditoga spiralis]
MKKTLTNYMITMNIVVFILMIIFGGFSALWGTSSRALLLFGAQYGPLVSNGQWFRTITSMFVHGGLLHIFFNMYALFYFGNIVESVYGKHKYFAVYILSGVMGNLLTQLMMPNAVSVGASGAIFGLIGLLFGSGFRHDTPRMLKPMVGTALLPIIIINIFLGFTVSSINNLAHIGGLAAGFTFGWLTPVTFTKTSIKIWKYAYYAALGLIVAAYSLLIFFTIIMLI